MLALAGPDRIFQAARPASRGTAADRPNPGSSLVREPGRPFAGRCPRAAGPDRAEPRGGPRETGAGCADPVLRDSSAPSGRRFHATGATRAGTGPGRRTRADALAREAFYWTPGRCAVCSERPSPKTRCVQR
ncbi:hypothetical protein GCM10020366_70140 [Saccharopolyspora gregorii]|uniref:Uncharacterized protein n=1 Tax=Saccharopolyspora gregorii TaxID=33914 RepID=A0ABP6RLV0_9PSEU